MVDKTLQAFWLFVGGFLVSLLFYQPLCEGLLGAFCRAPNPPVKSAEVAKIERQKHEFEKQYEKEHPDDSYSTLQSVQAASAKFGDADVDFVMQQKAWDEYSGVISETESRELSAEIASTAGALSMVLILAFRARRFPKTLKDLAIYLGIQIIIAAPIAGFFAGAAEMLWSSYIGKDMRMEIMCGIGGGVAAAILWFFGLNVILLPKRVPSNP